MEALAPVGRRREGVKEAAEGPEAVYFIVDGTCYAANQDIEVGGRECGSKSGQHTYTISRWQAQIQALRMICLDQTPQLCGCMVYGSREYAGRDWIVTPTEDWQSTESGIASTRLDAMDPSTSTQTSSNVWCEPSGSIDLSRVLKKLRLVLKLKKKKDTQVYIFIGSKMEGLDDVQDAALLADFRSLVSRVNIVAFGEECGTSTEGLLQNIAKCPAERQEDCLFPYACEHCGTVVVVQPKYTCSEENRRLKPNLYRSLVHNNIIRMQFLFSAFETKWQEVYKKPMEQGIASILSKSKLETKEKRLKAIAGTLSSYYSDYVSVEAAVRSDSSPPSSRGEEDDDENNLSAPSTLPTATALTRCGRQALHSHMADAPVKYMFGLSISDPERKKMNHIAVDVEELNSVLQVFMKPLVRLRCGKLLKSFGKEAGKLKGKMKLSAQSSKLGSLELWISFDESLLLVWSKGDKKNNASELGDYHPLLRVPGKREQWKNEMVLKKLSQDPSGRSFALCRIAGPNGVQTSMHCFWLSTSEDHMFTKLQEHLQNPPTLQDLLPEKQFKCLKSIQRSIQNHSEKLNKGVMKRMPARESNPFLKSLPLTSVGKGETHERKTISHTFKGNWMRGKLRPKKAVPSGSKGKALLIEKESALTKKPSSFVKEKDEADVEFEQTLRKLKNLESNHKSVDDDKEAPSPRDGTPRITHSKHFHESEEQKNENEELPKNVSLDNLFRFF